MCTTELANRQYGNNPRLKNSSRPIGVIDIPYLSCSSCSCLHKCASHKPIRLKCTIVAYTLAFLWRKKVPTTLTGHSYLVYVTSWAKLYIAHILSCSGSESETAISVRVLRAAGMLPYTCLHTLRDGKRLVTRARRETYTGQIIAALCIASCIVWSESRFGLQ